MLILKYPSKKAMIESLLGTKENPVKSQRLVMRYEETSFFGVECTDNCTVAGSNRPSMTRIMNPKTNRLASEFFASITIKDGYIIKIT